MTDLKPCPFCGGEARLYSRENPTAFYENDTEFSVSCKEWRNCRASVGWFDNEQDAVKAWSRRT